MHIRPATLADCSSTASMSVDAFWNDELYVYTHPRREQHPDHFRDLFLRKHCARYWSPGWIFHVAVTDAEDSIRPEGRVVGYAIWKRKGASEEAKKWQKQTYRAALECALLEATEQYLSFIRADKSVDPAQMCHFRSQAKENFEAIPEMWKLQNLCVHVGWQRRGIGSMLIEWGKEQAEEEGVPIGLESSAAARPTYFKNGFRRYGQMHMRDFPVEYVPIFIWEPKGMEGRWGMKPGDETLDVIG